MPKAKQKAKRQKREKRECQGCLDRNDPTTKPREWRGVKLDCYCNSCYWVGSDGLLYARLTNIDSDRIDADAL